jgi:diguanylate cyclase (GGDEF)-like protein
MSALQIFVLINGLMGCLMSMVVYAINRNSLVNVEGASKWVLSPLLSFIASLLYGVQGTFHHLISMALPNLLVVVSVWLQVIGTHQFFGKEVKKQYIYISLALSLVVFIFTSGKPDYFRERVMYVSGTVFLLLMMQWGLLWKNRKTGVAAKLMLVTLTVFNAVMLIRFVTASVQDISGSIYDFSAVQGLYLGMFSFGVVLLSISSILFMSERNRDELQRLLNEDALTGARTRRSILDMLEYEVERARRTPVKLSIMMIDVDHFKVINDRHGHVVGDEVLRQFVRSVKTSLRRPSEIGRYGGEEFLVVLPDTDAAQALQVAERIRSVVSTASPDIPTYTISIGIEELSKSGTHSVDPFIAKADNALYEAKRMGRDRVVLMQ